PTFVDEAGLDVFVAGFGQEQRRFRPLDAARLAVHRQLVAIARPEDPAANDSGGSFRARRQLKAESAARRRSSCGYPRAALRNSSPRLTQAQRSLFLHSRLVSY